MCKTGIRVSMLGKLSMTSLEPDPADRLRQWPQHSHCRTSFCVRVTQAIVASSLGCRQAGDELVGNKSGLGVSSMSTRSLLCSIRICTQ